MTKPWPFYTCHKIVQAFKIQKILSGFAIDNYAIIPEDATIPEEEVDREWFVKFRPVPGGYLVLYEDGYMSFSPAEAFEKGYTRNP